MLTFVLKESSSVSVARKKRKSGSLPSPALRFVVNKQPEGGLCRTELVTKPVALGMKALQGHSTIRVVRLDKPPDMLQQPGG